MKSNNFLRVCLLGFGLYACQVVQASNPGYKSTVEAKHGLGSTENPGYKSTMGAKHGLGSARRSLPRESIKGAPWTPWANYSGFYNSKRKTAQLTGKTGSVSFYDVKSISKTSASDIVYGPPYKKFAMSSNGDSIFYGRQGVSGVS